MTCIKFLCIDRSDASTFAGVVPKLRAAGARVSFVTGHMRAIDDSQVDGAPIERPSKPHGSWLLLRSWQRRLLARCDDAEHRAYARAWLSSFPEFLARCLRRERPALAVLPAPDIEPSLAAAVCERLGVRYACVLPQYYEFKYDAYLTAYARAAAHFVAGDFGLERLVAAGVPRASIHVVGNPKFDRNVRAARAPRAAPSQTILCAAQGLVENERLFDRLCRYVGRREGVRLILRLHPGAVEDPAVYRMIRDRSNAPLAIDIAPPGSLDEQLSSAAVLVTLTSNVILDAFILGVPAVMWAPECLPARVPFGVERGARVARDYGELEAALDALIFDRAYRTQWLSERETVHHRYVGTGSAADRLAHGLLAVARAGELGPPLTEALGRQESA